MAEGGGHVLLVEDTAVNRVVLTRFLQAGSYRVTGAGDGAEALAAIEAQRASGGFDLILLDMIMPNVDGYTVARTLRAAGDATRIVALTANASDSDRDGCLAAGCDDFLAKPIERARLLATVAQNLVAAASASGERP